jgi:hypothetical protein
MLTEQEEEGAYQHSTPYASSRLHVPAYLKGGERGAQDVSLQNEASLIELRKNALDRPIGITLDRP